MSLERAEILKFAVELRHKLHSQPETAWKEYNTSAYIREILTDNRIRWKKCAETGTIAVLAPEAKGRHVALRADIDALAIDEKTAVPYKSKNAGVMHACGHDGHTSALIAAALILKENEEKLGGPVTLVFQPGEEGGHGAKRILEEGCLKDVDCIFGWHNWPGIKFGEAACPDGVVMAANGTFHIDFYGKGGHSSQPEICRDPVLAASAVVTALQQIVSRRVAPQDSAVVSVTSFEAPSGLTTIPEHSRIEGSIRISDTLMRDRVGEMIKNIAEKTADAYGVRAEVELRKRYGATVNDADSASFMRECLKNTLGENWKSYIKMPVMASEDFSYYLEKIPGAYALIGSDDGNGHNIACHNAAYDFNDRLIEPAAELLVKLAGIDNK